MSLRTRIISALSKKEINRGLLPPGGQSSEEVKSMSGDLAGMSKYYDIINPYVPVSVLEYLTLLAVVNPNISQAVKNFQNIGNSGHRLVLDKKNTKAVNRLNEKAKIWYDKSAGIDGWVNHLFNQLCISGPISTEFVLQSDLRGVKSPVTVPAFSVRFKREDGEYKPYQLIGGDLIKLNEITYNYLAPTVMANSPYAIPPFTSVLVPIAIQQKMVKNIDFLMAKAGLLGFLNVRVKPLAEEPGDTPIKTKKRNQQYMEQVNESLKNNFSQGLMVTPDDWDVAFKSLAANAGGIKEIFQLNEEQMFSGLGIDPAMMGRSYSTTETYAGVVYEMHLKSVENMRRLIKRVIERMYYLDLALAGIPVSSVSIRFNDNKKLHPNIDALAKKYDTDIAHKKAEKGVISPTEAAQEMGHDDWFDEKKLNPEPKMELAWHRGAEEYRLVRPVHNIPATLAKKKKDKKDEAKDELSDEMLTRQVSAFLNHLLPYFDELKNDVISYAVDYVKDNPEEISEHPESLTDAVREYVENHDDYKDIEYKNSWFRKEVTAKIVEIGKEIKELDMSMFGDNPPDMSFEFGGPDLEAMEFFAKVDNFFFSKSISNKDFGPKITEFMTGFLERNEAVFGQWTEATEKEFGRLFGDAFDVDFKYQMERIINTSVCRIRTFSHFEKLHEAGFKYAKITGVSDACSVCKPLHGERIPVATVRDHIQGFIHSPSMEDAIEWIKNSNTSEDDVQNNTIDKLIENGKGFPPFHIWCRCIAIGDFED
ncbi:MAG: hypothetical protein GY765_10475 [bacterium]|nr:hypothetical protein [bacterium]